MQPIGVGVAGELAQEILIAGSLPAVGVLVVESCAGQRDVSGVRMHRLAPYVGAERGDQATRAEHIGKGGIGAVVGLDTYLPVPIKPNAQFLFLPPTGTTSP